MLKSLAISALALTLAASHAQCPAGYNCAESGVKPYNLLDPLISSTGKPIRTPAEWPARRAEIIRLFEQNIYGITPETARHLPLRPHVAERDTPALNGRAIRRQITLYFSDKADAGPREHILLYLPTQRAAGPIPVVLGINFAGNHTVINDPGIRLTPTWTRPDPKLPPRLGVPAESSRGLQSKQWQVERILAHGYAFATIYYGDIEPDYKDSWQRGIRPAFFMPGQTAPSPTDWGAIAAWGWGLSRALDYLETDRQIDAHRVAIVGHSRLGKTVDWAFAQDRRFAVLLSNEAGKAGDSILRRTTGENVSHLYLQFPYWFCANFGQWVGRETGIPADGNLLLSLEAPRPIYVAAAEGDRWSDPLGQFISARDPSRVYRLLGKPGISAATLPALDHPTDPTRFVAFHVRSGKHDVTAFDWEHYLTFLDAHFHPAAR